jgi:hypothetical protein
MNFNKIRYIQLLKQEKDFINEKKYMFDEDRDNYNELSTYKIMIEDTIFYQRREQINWLLQNFVNKKIDYREFTGKLDVVLDETQELIEELKINFEKIDNFSYNPLAFGFSQFLISGIVGDCEVFEPFYEGVENLGKGWLENCAKKAIIDIQKYL